MVKVFSKIFLGLAFLVFSVNLALASTSLFVPTINAKTADDKFLFITNKNDSMFIKKVDIAAKSTAYVYIMKDAQNFFSGQITGLALTKDGKFLLATICDQQKTEKSKILVVEAAKITGTSVVPSSVIDLNDYSYPMNITRQPGTDKFYFVDNNNGGNIYVYDHVSANLQIVIANSKSLMGLAFSPMGDRLYISDYIGKNVYIYDTASNSQIASQSTAKQPYQLLVKEFDIERTAADGKTKYLDSRSYLYVRSEDGIANNIGYYDVTADRFNWRTDIFTFVKSEMSTGNRFEPMTISHDAHYLYAAYADSATGREGIKVYSFFDNKSWPVESGMIELDNLFFADKPQPQIFGVFSGNGTWYAVTALKNLGYDDKGTGNTQSPTAPEFTYPLAGEQNAYGDAKWTASQDDGKPASIIYTVQYIKESDFQAKQYNWYYAGNTSATSLLMAFLIPGETYRLRIRAFDGYTPGVDIKWDEQGAFFSGWAYTGPFTVNDQRTKDSHLINLKVLLDGYAVNKTQGKLRPAKVLVEFRDTTLTKTEASKVVTIDDQGNGIMLISSLDDLGKKVLDNSYRLVIRQQIDGAKVSAASQKPNHLGVALKNTYKLSKNSNTNIDISLNMNQLEQDAFTGSSPANFDQSKVYLWGGDANGDGVVNALDMAPVQKSLLQKPGAPDYNPGADLNGDSIINAIDMGVIQRSLLKKSHNKVIN